MKNLYYTLPLDFSLLMKKNQEHTYSTYDQSIAQNLFILITSKYGEHRYDETLGCEIWESDFQLITNQNIWKEKIRKSIEELIVKFENRLKNCSVDVDLLESEIISPITNRKSIKKCIHLKINATTLLTGEKFQFVTKMFISPLSIE